MSFILKTIPFPGFSPLSNVSTPCYDAKMKKQCIALFLVAFCSQGLTQILAPHQVQAQMPSGGYYEAPRDRYAEPYMLEYLPPLMGARVMIVPHISIKKSGTQVTGNTSYRVGWCGNDRPTTREINGQWNGSKVELELKDHDGTTDVTLKGDVEPKSKVVRGIATFADGKKRRFALIPGEGGSPSSWDFPRPDHRDDKPYPELAEAKKLQEYAHHISCMHYPKALATMKKAMAIYNKLPADDIRRLEAQMYLVGFYANPNMEETDGGKSNICGKAKEAKETLLVVQSMLDKHDPSWEVGARGQRLVRVMQDAVQYYSMQRKDADVDKVYTKMIAVLSKGEDSKYAVPQAYERWSESIDNKAKKEKLKLQGLAIYDKFSDLPTRISLRNKMAMWYLQEDMPVKADLQMQEIARMLGMPDNNLHISSLN